MKYMGPHTCTKYNTLHHSQHFAPLDNYIYTYISMYILNVCTYVCMYVRMYVCTYVRMYVCTYVQLRIYISNTSAVHPLLRAKVLSSSSSSAFLSAARRISSSLEERGIGSRMSTNECTMHWRHLAAIGVLQ